MFLLRPGLFPYYTHATLLAKPYNSTSRVQPSRTCQVLLAAPKQAQNLLTGLATSNYGGDNLLVTLSADVGRSRRTALPSAQGRAPGREFGLFWFGIKRH